MTALIHGKSYKLYEDGCRCDACREYQRTRVVRNRAQRLAEGLLTHGTRSAYDAGCRCRECGAARREAYLRLSSEKWDHRLAKRGITP